MLRSGVRELAKEKFYAIRIWDVNIGNIVFSDLVKIKTNSKYLIEYSDKAIRRLVLVMPKMVDLLRHLKLKMEIN